MSIENPMKTEELKKSKSELADQEKAALDTVEGEGREKEAVDRSIFVSAPQIKLYEDIQTKAAAEANALFQENQKYMRSMGTKGWDKTTTLYKKWYNTTKLVQASEKLAKFYELNGDIDADYEKYDAMQMDKKNSTAAQRLEATDKVFELNSLRKQAAEMQKEISDLQETLKLLNEGAADDIKARNELEARWEGIELPKKKSLEQQVAEIKTDIEASEVEDAAKAKLDRQKELARAEADRIAAAQKLEAGANEYEKSLKGPFGWFKKLFSRKKDRVAAKEAEEAYPEHSANVDPTKRRWVTEQARKDASKKIKIQGPFNN